MGGYQTTCSGTCTEGGQSCGVQRPAVCVCSCWNYIKVAGQGIITLCAVGGAQLFIRESVDSLCRDDADMPMTPYIGKAYNRPNAAFVSLFR